MADSENNEHYHGLVDMGRYMAAFRLEPYSLTYASGLLKLMVYVPP